jgi:hypothetical protein
MDKVYYVQFSESSRSDPNGDIANIAIAYSRRHDSAGVAGRCQPSAFLCPALVAYRIGQSATVRPRRVMKACAIGSGMALKSATFSATTGRTRQPIGSNRATSAEFTPHFSRIFKKNGLSAEAALSPAEYKPSSVILSTTQHPDGKLTNL